MDSPGLAAGRTTRANYIWHDQKLMKRQLDPRLPHGASVPTALLTVMIALLAGCAVGPDYAAPTISTPDQWTQQISEDLQSGQASLQTWWATFDDPQLNELIVEAGRKNLDLRLAVARIAEARAARGVASGSYWPDINGKGSIQRSRNSEEIAPILPPGVSRSDGFVVAGLDSSWEIDLWGRISRTVESADAAVEASVEDFRDVQVVLYAEVARAYIDLRSTQRRIALAQENVASQTQTLALVQERFKAQLVPELDVQQATQNLSRTESVIPDLLQQEDRLWHRLSVLLGEYPGPLRQRLAPGSIPQATTKATVLLPAELLRQRPDLRAAERALAGQTARIGVAKADLYPRLSLTGSFAFEATTGSFESVFRRGNLAWSVGPVVQWNLFDGNRIRSQVQVEDARTEQALVAYERAILVAVEEMESSLSAYRHQVMRRDALKRSAEAAQKTEELVEVLYRNGLTDFQNVLDSQRTLVEAQDALAASDGLVSRNLVTIYQALGGGWAPEATATVEPESSEQP